MPMLQDLQSSEKLKQIKTANDITGTNVLGYNFKWISVQVKTEVKARTEAIDLHNANELHQVQNIQITKAQTSELAETATG